MRASLPLIDNLITYVYPAINSIPCSAAPRSQGHHRDSRMRAASIELVPAGQASVCYTTVKRLSRTDTDLNGTPCVTSCSLMMQRQEGTHRKCWAEGSGNGGVRCLRSLSPKLTEFLYFHPVRY